MLIAHISDFHVFADAPETALVRTDAADAARKVVADIAAHQPVFDAVIFTGDLVDGGSTADYALMKDILAPLHMPIFVVPGNHDKRDSMRAAFQDTVLSHLPPDRRPMGPRSIPDDVVQPDPIAYRDDMAHVADVLDSGSDARTLD